MGEDPSSVGNRWDEKLEADFGADAAAPPPPEGRVRMTMPRIVSGRSLAPEMLYRSMRQNLYRVAKCRHDFPSGAGGQATLGLLIDERKERAPRLPRNHLQSFPFTLSGAKLQAAVIACFFAAWKRSSRRIEVKFRAMMSASNDETAPMARVPERLSIELTNRCFKGCDFCYAGSHAEGTTRWSVEALADFVESCAGAGTAAVSFGGGEPFEFAGVFELLARLRGVVFRSMTTHGLSLGEHFDALLEAQPDKVHVSIHQPQRRAEVERVIAQVAQLEAAGIVSGVNLLVRRSALEAATTTARSLWAAGIDNARIVYLPMRGHDTPTPAEVAAVAGARPFQSMSCLKECKPSARFVSIGWDRSVAWCSYTSSRRPLTRLDAAGLARASVDLPLLFCASSSPVVLRPARSGARPDVTSATERPARTGPIPPRAQSTR